MKPAARYGGVVHERVEVPDAGSLFNATVLGADASQPGDTVSLQTSGRGVSMSLRFTRDQARRIGELLIQAADDGLPGVRS